MTSIITLTLRQLTAHYRAGVRVTVREPVLRTCEDNYFFQDRLINQNGEPREYCTTVNSADFQRLRSLRSTQTTTKEGN